MRIPLLLAAACLAVVLPATSFAKDRFLQRRVQLVGEQDELKPVVGQDVTVVESGDTARTKEGGRFRLFLKDIFKEGSKLTLAIDKKGWLIQYPLDGEARVPADLEKELVEIRLLPVGSKKLWSADRIEKFIRDMADKAKTQVTREGKPQDVDFSRYIKDWAVQYGVSPQQAKAEIDKWVADAEQKNDPYQLGLAAYAKKNFGEAGKLFEESAAGKVRGARDASAKVQQLTEEAIRDYRLAGDAHTNNYQFDQARGAYESARNLTARTDHPRLWADLTLLVGNAESEIGSRTESDRIHRHLGNAVAAYREALTVRTQVALPQDWAMTQNNLAKAALALEDWSTAAESSRHVLTLYPDYDEAYQRAHLVYHEKLFAYASAFEVTTHWLDRHPEDVPAQANFAEAHLTTGHFAEAERHLEQLLKKPDLDSTSSVGLRIVDMVTALALKKAAAVPQKLQELRTFLSQQPETFQAGWSFDGTAHYVQTEQVFARYRPWLMELFAVVKAKDRAALLAALDRVQAGFTP